MELPITPLMQPDKKTERYLVDTFVAHYSAMLQRLSERMRNREDARDALQNAFIKCWQNRTRVGHVRDLAGWVWQVSLNAGRDVLRDAWRRRARPLEAAPEPSSLTRPAPEVLLDQEREHGLQAALLNLKPEEREVFQLRRHGPHRWKELAAQCHRPINTVKTQLRSAVHKLQQMLGEPARMRGR